MAHVFETAKSGRAACRACRVKIGKGELRYGQRVPNPFGDGDATFWFHPRCAAERVPEGFVETLEAHEGDVDGRDELAAVAAETEAHPRLARFSGMERASSGRAKCRQCGELIEKGLLRVVLDVVDEGMLQGLGFVHLTCAPDYFELSEAPTRFSRKAEELGDDAPAELERVFGEA